MQEDLKQWIRLRRWANEYQEQHGHKALDLALDGKILKAAFFVIENCIKESDQFIVKVCSRKFNLMSILFSYPILVNRCGLIRIEKLPKEDLAAIFDEVTTNWPDWHGYNEEQMTKICHACSEITHIITDVNEARAKGEKKEFIIE